MVRFLLQSAIRFMSSLSLPRAMAFGRGLGWMYGSVIRYHRPDAIAALKRSFPKKSGDEIDGLVNRMYANLGMNLVEVARLAGGRPDELEKRVTVEGVEYAREAHAQGKGILILTAHLGNWDLLGMYTPKLGYPLTIISKNVKDPAVNEMWMNLRKEYGVNIVPAHNSYRDCLRVLRRNELLGFILDQNRPRDEGIFVDFFGRPASTTPGLAYLAAQTKAPVLPVFIERTGPTTHTIHAYPALPPPPNRDQPAIHDATQQYTRIIEDEIRKYPDQWTWIHRRWKTQPLPDKSSPA